MRFSKVKLLRLVVALFMSGLIFCESSAAIKDSISKDINKATGVLTTAGAAVSIAGNGAAIDTALDNLKTALNSCTAKGQAGKDAIVFKFGTDIKAMVDAFESLRQELKDNSNLAGATKGKIKDASESLEKFAMGIAVSKKTDANKASHTQVTNQITRIASLKATALQDWDEAKATQAKIAPKMEDVTKILTTGDPAAKKAAENALDSFADIVAPDKKAEVEAAIAAYKLDPKASTQKDLVAVLSTAKPEKGTAADFGAAIETKVKAAEAVKVEVAIAATGGAKPSEAFKAYVNDGNTGPQTGKLAKTLKALVANDVDWWNKVVAGDTKVKDALKDIKAALTAMHGDIKVGQTDFDAFFAIPAGTANKSDRKGLAKNLANAVAAKGALLDKDADIKALIKKIDAFQLFVPQMKGAVAAAKLTKYEGKTNADDALDAYKNKLEDQFAKITAVSDDFKAHAGSIAPQLTALDEVADTAGLGKLSALGVGGAGTEWAAFTTAPTGPTKAAANALAAAIVGEAKGLPDEDKKVAIMTALNGIGALVDAVVAAVGGSKVKGFMTKFNTDLAAELGIFETGKDLATQFGMPTDAVKTFVTNIMTELDNISNKILGGVVTATASAKLTAFEAGTAGTAQALVNVIAPASHTPSLADQKDLTASLQSIQDNVKKAKDAYAKGEAYIIKFADDLKAALDFWSVGDGGKKLSDYTATLGTEIGVLDGVIATIATATGKTPAPTWTEFKAGVDASGAATKSEAFVSSLCNCVLSTTYNYVPDAAAIGNLKTALQALQKASTKAEQTVTKSASASAKGTAFMVSFNADLAAALKDFEQPAVLGTPTLYNAFASTLGVVTTPMNAIKTSLDTIVGITNALTSPAATKSVTTWTPGDFLNTKPNPAQTLADSIADKTLSAGKIDQQNLRAELKKINDQKLIIANNLGGGSGGVSQVKLIKDRIAGALSIFEIGNTAEAVALSDMGALQAALEVLLQKATGTTAAFASFGTGAVEAAWKVTPRVAGTWAKNVAEKISDIVGDPANAANLAAAKGKLTDVIKEAKDAALAGGAKDQAEQIKDNIANALDVFEVGHDAAAVAPSDMNNIKAALEALLQAATATTKTFAAGDFSAVKAAWKITPRGSGIWAKNVAGKVSDIVGAPANSANLPTAKAAVKNVIVEATKAATKVGAVTGIPYPDLVDSKKSIIEACIKAFATDAGPAAVAVTLWNTAAAGDLNHIAAIGAVNDAVELLGKKDGDPMGAEDVTAKTARQKFFNDNKNVTVDTKVTTAASLVTALLNTVKADIGVPGLIASAQKTITENFIKNVASLRAAVDAAVNLIPESVTQSLLKNTKKIIETQLDRFAGTNDAADAVGTLSTVTPVKTAADAFKSALEDLVSTPGKGAVVADFGAPATLAGKLEAQIIIDVAKDPKKAKKILLQLAQLKPLVDAVVAEIEKVKFASTTAATTATGLLSDVKNTIEAQLTRFKSGDATTANPADLVTALKALIMDTDTPANNVKGAVDGGFGDPATLATTLATQIAKEVGGDIVKAQTRLKAVEKLPSVVDKAVIDAKLAAHVSYASLIPDILTSTLDQLITKADIKNKIKATTDTGFAELTAVKTAIKAIPGLSTTSIGKYFDNPTGGSFGDITNLVNKIKSAVQTEAAKGDANAKAVQKAIDAVNGKIDDLVKAKGLKGPLLPQAEVVDDLKSSLEPMHKNVDVWGPLIVASSVSAGAAKAALEKVLDAIEIIPNSATANEMNDGTNLYWNANFANTEFNGMIAAVAPYISAKAKTKADLKAYMSAIRDLDKKVSAFVAEVKKIKSPKAITGLQTLIESQLMRLTSDGGPIPPALGMGVPAHSYPGDAFPAWAKAAGGDGNINNAIDKIFNKLRKFGGVGNSADAEIVEFDDKRTEAAARALAKKIFDLVTADVRSDPSQTATKTATAFNNYDTFAQKVTDLVAALKVAAPVGGGGGAHGGGGGGVVIDDVSILKTVKFDGDPLFDSAKLAKGTVTADVVDGLKSGSTTYLSAANKALFGDAGDIKTYVTKGSLAFKNVEKVNNLIVNLTDPRLKSLKDYIIDLVYNSATPVGATWKDINLIPPLTEDDFNNAFN